MNEDAFTQLLQQHAAILVYVGSPDCAVCAVLKPKLKTQITAQFPRLYWQEINAQEAPALLGQLQIFSVPTVLVYFEGNETMRQSRNFSVQALLDALKRPYKLRYNTVQ